MSARPPPEPDATDPTTTGHVVRERTRAEIIAFLDVGRRFAGPETVARLAEELLSDDE